MSTNLSDLPILAPLNAVLHDEKVVLVALWLASTVIATSVPALAPYIGTIVPALVVIYGGLILHQGGEDILAAYRGDTPTDIPDALNTIEQGIVGDVLKSGTSITTSVSSTPTAVG